MSLGVQEAANIRSPIASLVYRVPISTTAARFIVPAGLRGQMCSWMVEGAAITKADIIFGGSGVAAVLAQESAVNAEALTVNAGTGKSLRANVEYSWVCPDDVSGNVYFSVDADNTGTLTFHAS